MEIQSLPKEQNQRAKRNLGSEPEIFGLSPSQFDGVAGLKACPVQDASVLFFVS